MTNDLILERQLPADPARVWRCWTEAKLLMQWFVPPPTVMLDAVIEPHPGGRFYTSFSHEGQQMGGEGCILLAEPPSRLVWTGALSRDFRPNNSAGEPFLFTADITMEPKDGGTFYRVIARHTDAAGAQAHEKMGFSQGWGSTTDAMGALAATL